MGREKLPSSFSSSVELSDSSIEVSSLIELDGHFNEPLDSSELSSPFGPSSVVVDGSAGGFLGLNKISIIGKHSSLCSFSNETLTVCDSYSLSLISYCVTMVGFSKFSSAGVIRTSIECCGVFMIF